METIQTQIRPQNEMPLVVNIPEFPRLRDMKTRLESFRNEINDKRSQIVNLTREGEALNRKAQSDPDSEIFVRVAQIKRELSQLESQMQTTQGHFKRSESEHQQWLQSFAWKFYRVRWCRTELAELGAGPQTPMQTHSVGVMPQRTRIEILSELTDSLKWLAAFSGDPKFADEWAAAEKQLTEAWATQS